MTTPPGDPWETPPRMAPEGTGPGAPPPPPPMPPPGYGPPADYGQPPGYAPPGYGPGYGYRQPSNGMGVAALVLGIIGAVGSLIVIGAALSVLAIIFGAIGRSKAKRNEATNGGMALAGLILGILGCVIAGAIIAFYAANEDDFKNYEACKAAATSQAELQACADEFGRELFS